MTATDQNTRELETLVSSLGSLRTQIMNHALYNEISTIHDVHILMEHHVFAVFDFMSLLKALQLRLTCAQVPWVPRENHLACRLINEIVLAEESDDIPGQGYTSHFELYLKSMIQCGADTSSVDSFVKAMSEGVPIHTAVQAANVPPAARDFLLTTWSFIESDSTQRMAAALTLGREDIIPEMFKSMIFDLNDQFPNRLSNFTVYLERHIDLDGDEHRPMALQMLNSTCNTKADWKEAKKGAELALQARIDLWNGVLLELNRTHERTIPVMNVASVG